MDVASRHLTRELLRRVTPPPTVVSGAGVVADVRRKLRSALFDKQLAFLDDPAKSKAACCSRRAGKTTETSVDLVDGVLETPGSKALYATLTRERAKELLWPELHALDKRFLLGMRFNEVELTTTLPESLGGGIVKLTGADKAKEIQKRRGDKLKRARIDEAQAFGAYLKEFVDDVLEPALMDLKGDLGLLGTPGPVCAGLFHDVTTGKTPGWSRHHWTVRDNPHVPHADEWLRAKKLERGWTDESPTYRREWLGEWVNDTGALYYRFDVARHLHDGLPEGHEWHYVLAWDLGWHDAMALVVWAFSPTCPTLYEVYSWKQSGLTPSQVAEHIQGLQERFNFIAYVADTGGLGKAIVEDVRERYGLPFEAAEKTHKLAAVEVMNDDFDRGRIKVRRDSPLARELAVLPKDPEDPTREDSRFDNHCADAGLYGHRKSLHYAGREVEAGPPEGTPEWHEKQAAERKERHRAAYERRQREAQEDAW